MLTLFRFASEDNSNCRVYYRRGRQLFCWQDDGSWGRHDWRCYVCSSDGEPSHPATIAPAAVPPCPGETATGRDFNAWLAST